VNVKETLCPEGRLPELKRPPSAVTVWVVISRFVNVTRVPTRTLSALGLNAKLIILTDAAIGGGGGGGGGAIVGRGVDTTGCGVGAGVALGAGVGEAVGEAVGLATATGLADGNVDGEDWLVTWPPQAVSKNAATIVSAGRLMRASVGKFIGG
jgi:hypothetical protein